MPFSQDQDFYLAKAAAADARAADAQVTGQQRRIFEESAEMWRGLAHGDATPDDVAASLVRLEGFLG